MIPPEALRSNASLIAPPVTVEATAGLAFARGSLLTHLHEEDLRSQDLTLNLTLLEDSFVELLELKYAHLLIEGISSRQSEARGWNRIYRDYLRPFHVRRIDAKTVSIALPRRQGYEITELEEITITIPPAAVKSNRTLVAQPGLLILPVPGVAYLSSPAPVNDETAIRAAAPYPLELLLVNDTWKGGALEHDTGEGTFTGLRLGLRTDYDGSIPQPFGWGQVVQTSLYHTRLALSNQSTLITVMVPQQADYEIEKPEFLTLTVPPSAVASRQRLRAKGKVRLNAARGVALLQGTLLETPTEQVCVCVSIPRPLGCIALSLLRCRLSPLLTQRDRTSHAQSIKSDTPLSVFVLLDGERFERSVGEDTQSTREIILGIRARDQQPAGWNNVVQQLLSTHSVTKFNDTALEIKIEQCAQYSIAEPQTITMLIPESALISHLPMAAAPSIVIRATPGYARLGGSLAAHPSEMALRDGLHGGASFLTVTLYDDEWREAALAERDVVSLLVDGMLSEQDEANGFNARVRPVLAQTNMTLESSVAGGLTKATLRVTLPPVKLYSISEPETIYITLPPNSVRSAAPIRVSPPLVIVAERRTARFGGHLHEHNEEFTLRSDALSNLTITLEDDTWQPTVGQPHLGPEQYALQRAILDGLVASESSSSTGWAQVVGPALQPHHVQRLDDRTMLIDLEQFAAYSINSPETVVALIPPSAVLSRVSPSMRSPLIIRPSQGRARLSGTFLDDASEAAVNSAATLTLAITLIGDAWNPAVGRQETAADDAVARDLLDGIVPSLDTAHSWASIVQASLTPMHVYRSGPSTVVIHIPQKLSYDILEPVRVARP